MNAQVLTELSLDARGELGRLIRGIETDLIAVAGLARALEEVALHPQRASFLISFLGDRDLFVIWRELGKVTPCEAIRIIRLLLDAIVRNELQIRNSPAEILRALQVCTHMPDAFRSGVAEFTSRNASINV